MTGSIRMPASCLKKLGEASQKSIPELRLKNDRKEDGDVREYGFLREQKLVWLAALPGCAWQPEAGQMWGLERKVM